jgi:serine/threonine-protein kinase HipA
MARTPKRLGVWLDGERIADLEQERGRLFCRYTDEALATWPGNSPLISCSLPLQERRQDALAFCKGLLPEGRALQSLADKAGLATNDTFGLLERYGRDVAGALVISTTAPEPRRYGAQEYDRNSLTSAVEDLDEDPLGVDDESELSLAGLQDKLLLVEIGDGVWAKPLRGRPSTHILKRDDLRYPGLIAAEKQCLDLARALGLTTIDTQLERFGSFDCLIVSRFDRRIEGQQVNRIHQEDVCQALGIDPDGHERRAKYGRASGPSLRHIAELLDRYAEDPANQLDRLVGVITFIVLTGNADAHGKNLAFLHPTPETISLAPLYDTVPTVLWPTLRTASAMAIGAKAELGETTVDDIVREAKRWDHPEVRAREMVERTIEQTHDCLKAGVIDPKSDLHKFVRRRLRELAKGRPRQAPAKA